MAEYIKREDALNAIRKSPISNMSTRLFCVDAIADIPAADVVERRHGEWVWSEEQDGAICSECKAHKGGRLTPFCPNCGATMEADFLHKR